MPSLGLLLVKPLVRRARDYRYALTFRVTRTTIARQRLRQQRCSMFAARDLQRTKRPKFVYFRLKHVQPPSHVKRTVGIIRRTKERPVCSNAHSTSKGLSDLLIEVCDTLSK
jgi:hypothetical protein